MTFEIVSTDQIRGAEPLYDVRATCGRRCLYTSVVIYKVIELVTKVTSLGLVYPGTGVPYQ